MTDKEIRRIIKSELGSYTIKFYELTEFNPSEIECYHDVFILGDDDELYSLNENRDSDMFIEDAFACMRQTYGATAIFVHPYRVRGGNSCGGIASNRIRVYR